MQVTLAIKGPSKTVHTDLSFLDRRNMSIILYQGLCSWTSPGFGSHAIPLMRSPHFKILGSWSQQIKLFKRMTRIKVWTCLQPKHAVWTRYGLHKHLQDVEELTVTISSCEYRHLSPRSHRPSRNLLHGNFLTSLWRQPTHITSSSIVLKWQLHY